MKTITGVLLFLLMFSCLYSMCQTTDSIETIVKKIKVSYSEINNDTKLRCQKEDLTEISTEGGILEKYYKSETLCKAVLMVYGENGKLTIEYYFQKGAIIFVYEKEDRYGKPIYEKGGSNVKHTNKNRFYFNYGKLIKWIGIDERIVDAKKYEQKEKDIKEGLKKYALQ